MQAESSAGGVKVAVLTLLAMLAFAGNSVLNRAALADEAIDWAAFTSVRLVSGALMLALLLGLRHGRGVLPRISNGMSVVALFGYAALFSLAYLDLTAATGALILFACVQISMQAIGLASGHKVRGLQWAGLIVAFAGLVWLLLPGLAAPPLWPSVLMAGAGLAWGIYSWLGRSAQNPSLATARNFIGTVPLAFALLFLVEEIPGSYGLMLAITSGVITSALGYVIWYAVLPHLSVVTAGVVQLSVPAIAALGGILFLSEAISLRLFVATVLIFAGIALTLRAKAK